MGDSTRIVSAAGSPRAVGLALGRAMGARLGRNLDTYRERGPGGDGSLDRAALSAGAMPWFERLPERFREEIEGLAEGAGLPLLRLAEWCYVEEFIAGRCTSVVGRVGGKVWLGRNNDYLPVGLWGYATVRAIDELIPTVCFGMEAEPFTITGANAESLWLHHHYLPAGEALPVTGAQRALPSYVWLTEALETCGSLADVEARLRAVPRSDGMMLFAVEGSGERAAIFECDRVAHRRHDLGDGWLVGANHRRAEATEDDESLARYMRAAELVGGLGEDATAMPQRLRALLADTGVEQRGAGFGTVYSAVACPGSGDVWFTFGGYPAASRGNWQRVPWPWPQHKGRGRPATPVGDDLA